MRYCIVQCKGCGYWGGKQYKDITKTTYVCNKCNNKFKLKVKGTFGLCANIKFVDDVRDIRVIVPKLNMRSE